MAGMGLEEMARGLKESIYDPIASDASDAYWNYRATRERYPAADGVLNITPYVGAAINADDMYRDLHDGASVGETASDAAGGAINAGMSLKYLKAAKEAVKFAKSGKNAGTGVGDGMAAYSGALMSTPVLGYINHYADKQREADEKYADVSVHDLANQLRERSDKSGGVVSTLNSWGDHFRHAIASMFR